MIFRFITMEGRETQWEIPVAGLKERGVDMDEYIEYQELVAGHTLRAVQHDTGMAEQRKKTRKRGKDSLPDSYKDRAFFRMIDRDIVEETMRRR